jgi:hypothetical protein
MRANILQGSWAGRGGRGVASGTRIQHPWFKAQRHFPAATIQGQREAAGEAVSGSTVTRWVVSTAFQIADLILVCLENLSGDGRAQAPLVTCMNVMLNKMFSLGCRSVHQALQVRDSIYRVPLDINKNNGVDNGRRPSRGRSGICTRTLWSFVPEHEQWRYGDSEDTSHHCFALPKGADLFGGWRWLRCSARATPILSF